MSSKDSLVIKGDIVVIDEDVNADVDADADVNADVDADVDVDVDVDVDTDDTDADADSDPDDADDGDDNGVVIHQGTAIAREIGEVGIVANLDLASITIGTGWNFDPR